MLLFYFVIVMYTLLAVVHVNGFLNLIGSMVFEGIGFVLLACLVLSNILFRNIKIGYYAPLIMITVFYILLLNVINLFCVKIMPNSLFILVNLIVLFAYCLLAIPMYIKGMVYNKEEYLDVK